jgi:hypothetical protein
MPTLQLDFAATHSRHCHCNANPRDDKENPLGGYERSLFMALAGAWNEMESPCDNEKFLAPIRQEGSP